LQFNILNFFRKARPSIET